MSVSYHATRSNAVLLYAAVAFSLIAALIHLWVMPEHFEEWWGYGTFFLICALAQGLFALGLLRRPSRVLLLLGVGGNLAIVILWLVTRTAGIPLLASESTSLHRSTKALIVQQSRIS